MGRKGLPPVIHLSLRQDTETLATWQRVYALLLERGRGCGGGWTSAGDPEKRAGDAEAGHGETPAIETEVAGPGGIPPGQAQGGGGG